MKKISVLIGRFQPLHAGHKALILAALESCESLIILVGSANKPRSKKNPWTFEERRDQILDFLYNAEIYKTVHIAPINDYKYSDTQWCSDVVSTVNRFNHKEIYKINLVGHSKKGNSYLKYFPQWGYTEIQTGIVLNATDVREEMLEAKSEYIHPSVHSDHEYFVNEKKRFKDYPFPETLNFACADAILECAGNILLIKRKFSPGAGTWALPGGFKNNTETRLQCAVRELLEETNVRIPEKIILGSMVRSKLYDAVDRGCGIPRETMAFLFRVEPNNDGSLPRANGADDAMECRWVPIADVMNNYELFDDHLDIIQDMTGASSIMAINNPRINNSQ